MKTFICLWCRKPLPARRPDGTDQASHGICVPCALRQIPPHLHENFKRYREAA